MNERIESNPSIFNGQPYIKGTQVLVSTILSALSAGDTFENILEDHPNLRREDIQAAVLYAGDHMTY